MRHNDLGNLKDCLDALTKLFKAIDNAKPLVKKKISVKDSETHTIPVPQLLKNLESLAIQINDVLEEIQHMINDNGLWSYEDFINYHEKIQTKFMNYKTQVDKNGTNDITLHTQAIRVKNAYDQVYNAFSKSFPIKNDETRSEEAKQTSASGAPTISHKSESSIQPSKQQANIAGITETALKQQVRSGQKDFSSATLVFSTTQDETSKKATKHFFQQYNLVGCILSQSLFDYLLACGVKNFAGAVLDNLNLSKDLSDCDFTNAKLNGATLTGMIVNDNTHFKGIYAKNVVCDKFKYKFDIKDATELQSDQFIDTFKTQYNEKRNHSITRFFDKRSFADKILSDDERTLGSKVIAILSHAEDTPEHKPWGRNRTGNVLCDMKRDWQENQELNHGI